MIPFIPYTVHKILTMLSIIHSCIHTIIFNFVLHHFVQVEVLKYNLANNKTKWNTLIYVRWEDHVNDLQSVTITLILNSIPK